MYAYNDGVNGWDITGVTTDFELDWQRVGLAFDANDVPVISFLAGTGSTRQIFLAYDPVATPEPSTMLLLAAAGATWLAVRRSRRGNS